MKPDNRSIAQQWTMYHKTPPNFESVSQNVEAVILHHGTRKAKLKLPVHFSSFEFEGYAYFIESGEEIKKMQENKIVWKYTPITIRITLSEKQFELLFNSLSGKNIEDM